MANSAIIPRPSSSFGANLYSAFILVQDSYPIHSTSDLPFLEHLSCAAGTNSDVLHYGAMLKDADNLPSNRTWSMKSMICFIATLSS
jgi:hypothetical protein